MPAQTVAIMEPDEACAGRLAAMLGEHGYAAEILAGPGALLAKLPHQAPDLILLGDGGGPKAALGTLRLIRDLSLVPCIVLTANADDVSEILVLQAGADGQADRAVPLRTLLARIRAVLRRAEWGCPPRGVLLIEGGWRLELERRRLLRPDGAECPLTTAEFDLMRLLAERRGTSVTRDAIAQAVFRRPFRAEDRTVDNLVLRLRRKLGPEQQASIKTVRGAGYLFGGFLGAGMRVA